MRGDVHRLRAPRQVRGHEQAGARYAVVVQSDDLLLSTLLVVPTSRSAPARIFRPSISIAGEPTTVLVEQLTAVAPERLGEVVGRVSLAELQEIDAALALALALD